MYKIKKFKNVLFLITKVREVEHLLATAFLGHHQFYFSEPRSSKRFEASTISDTRGINAVGCYKLLYLTIQITSCSPVHFSVSSHLPSVLVSSPVIDVYRDAVFVTIQRCFTLLIRRQDQKAPDYLAIGHVSTLTVEKWQKEFNWKERLSFKGVQKRFTKPFTTFLNWSLTVSSARTSLGHFCILAERQFE